MLVMLVKRNRHLHIYSTSYLTRQNVASEHCFLFSLIRKKPLNQHYCYLHVYREPAQLTNLHVYV